MDVKVLFDPVNYVAFPGLANGGPTQVTFVDGPALNRREEQLQKSIEKTIDAGNFE